MRLNDVQCRGPWPVTLTAMALMLFTVPGLAASRIDEIRTIVVQKGLQAPTPKALEALNENNLDAGLQAMDLYARYVPPAHLTDNASHSVHLGAEFFVHNSRAWVRPDPGGPADKAGVPEIGELRAINGKRMDGGGLATISSVLDKAIQSDFVGIIVAKRPGGRSKRYKVKPAAYQLPSITWRRVGTVLVLHINEFVAHDTAPGLSARLKALVRPGDRVVFDLRGCPGGDLYEALEIAGMFVPAGRPLVLTNDRSNKIQTFRSPRGKKQQSPFLLLIDSRTASAAEILVGILQYHGLAHVVGERSYGKCVSQTLFPLSDRGGLWLTTLAVNFPNNMSCNGAGIAPDILFPDISVTKTENIVNKISLEKIRSH